MTALLAITACSGADEPVTAINLTDNGLPTPVAARTPPSATGPGTALGLTYLELEDADILDAAGREIAVVHEIDADYAGTIGGLAVKLKGPPSPGRLVRIGLQGLTVVPDGTGWDLRTTATGNQLAALPTFTPKRK